MPARLVVAPSRQYGQKSIGTQGFLIRCKVTAQKHTRCPIGVLLCRPTTLCLPLPEPAQSPHCFRLLTHYSNPIGVLSALLPTMGKSIPICTSDRFTVLLCSISSDIGYTISCGYVHPLAALPVLCACGLCLLRGCAGLHYLCNLPFGQVGESNRLQAKVLLNFI